MPELDLDALSISDAAMRILAVIHHSRNLEEQNKFFERLQNASTRAAYKKGRPVAWYRIDQALIGDSSIDRRDKARTGGVRVCAYMFMRALVDGESLRSVISELGKTFKRKPTTCWEDWRQNRPAAHLGAAFMFCPKLWEVDPPKLAKFLAIAEELRRRGEVHKLRGHEKGTLLDPAETWRVPQDLILPEMVFQLPPAGSISFRP